MRLRICASSDLIISNSSDDRPSITSLRGLPDIRVIRMDPQGTLPVITLLDESRHRDANGTGERHSKTLLLTSARREFKHEVERKRENAGLGLTTNIGT